MLMNADLYAFAYPRSTWTYSEELAVSGSVTFQTLIPFTMSEPDGMSPTVSITVRGTDVTVTATDGTTTQTVTCGATEETQTATLAIAAIDSALTVSVAPRSGQPSGTLYGIFIRETPLTSGQLP